MAVGPAQAPRGADGSVGEGAERRFSRAWAAALGSRRHADLHPPLRRRRPVRVAPCAAVPRVIGLPLQHSPVPSALGFLQRPAGAEMAGHGPAASHLAGRQAAATGGQP